MSSNHSKRHNPNRGVPLLSQKMKTLQSIGTFNETPVNLNQFDQSIVSKRQVFVQNPFLSERQDTLKESQINTNDPKASKIESDVGQIARMKMLFESRVNNQKQAASRLHNKSLDKSPNGRSIQKHVLKPTHTPSFNKFEPKNISYSIIQPNPPISLKFNNSNSHSGVVEQQQSQDKRRGQYMQSSSKKSVMDCSQISSKFAEYEFGDGFMDRERDSRVSNQNQHFREMSSETPMKIDFSGLKVVNPNSSNNSDGQIKSFQKCSCQQILGSFMQQTSGKLTQLTQRLMYLQQENGRLRQLESKVIQQSQSLRSYQEQHQIMSRECSQLRESNYTYQAQKTQLQTLLKQILFKREKQKFQRSCQGSKQNTFREEQNTATYKKSTMSTGNGRRMEENGSNGHNEHGSEDGHGGYIQETHDRQEIYDTNENTNGRKNMEMSFKRQCNNNHTNYTNKRSVQPLGVRGPNIQNSLYAQTNKEQIYEIKTNKKDTQSNKLKVQNLLSKLQIKIQKS